MEDGYGAGLNGMGADTYMNEDFYQDRDEDTTMNVQSSMNMEYDPIADAKKEAENEEKRYKQILKRFRVIRPEEVNKMLNDQETNKPSGMINQDGSQTPRGANNQKIGQPYGNSMLPGLNGDNSGTKKRTREEMMSDQPAGRG